MAAKSSLRNMTLCLTAVCLVCAAILGGVYALTYEPIKAADEAALKAGIGAVLPEGVNISGEQICEGEGQSYSYYTATDAGGDVVAYAVKSNTMGFGGTLSLMVGVLPDGTVYNTSVLSHSETPGLGAKCTTDQSFMSQWKGLSPDKVIKVTKDGGDIDAITASTITSRAYSLAVANAVAVAKSLASGRQKADGVSGATVRAEDKQTTEGGADNE